MTIKYHFNLGKLLLVGCYAAAAVVFLRGDQNALIKGLIVVFLAIILACLKIELPDKGRTAVSITAVVLISGVLFFVTQLQLHTWVNYMAARFIVMGMLICLAVNLFFVYVFARVIVGVTIGSAILMVITQIDDMIYTFRGTELLPGDFLTVRTGANVFREYHYVLPQYSVLAIGIMLLVILLFSVVEYDKIDRKKAAGACGCGLAGTLIVIALLTNGQTSHRWENGGMWYRGFLPNFVLELKESRIKKPVAYNAAELESQTAGYTDSNDGRNPNIIVIMNEAFADLDEYGNRDFTDQPVMPFIDSLEEDTIRGYAWSSVYGGGTHCSEFEFLTGNTMAFLPPGSVPYQQYVDERTVSMATVLHRYGYCCEAMHPYYASGWDREHVYPLLGFDRTAYLDDFPQEYLIREYESDLDMYKYIASEYESLEEGPPLFFFGVTMQNHGGYGNEDYEARVHITGHEGEYPDAEQYLSLINQSDEAFEYLIEYFTSVDEDTIILMFGDHWPSLSSDFYTDILGDPELQEFRKIPFILWANYDIQESKDELTSINYLSTYVYQTAGIHPGYAAVLKDLQNAVPGICSMGYYSLDKGAFVSLSEAEGDEKSTLEYYQKLQYNNLFDHKHRIDLFERYMK